MYFLFLFFYCFASIAMLVLICLILVVRAGRTFLITGRPVMMHGEGVFSNPMAIMLKGVRPTWWTAWATPIGRQPATDVGQTMALGVVTPTIQRSMVSCIAIT